MNPDKTKNIFYTNDQPFFAQLYLRQKGLIALDHMNIIAQNVHLLNFQDMRFINNSKYVTNTKLGSKPSMFHLSGPAAYDMKAVYNMLWWRGKVISRHSRIWVNGEYVPFRCVSPESAHLFYDSNVASMMIGTQIWKRREKIKQNDFNL
eukprot:NODE_5743_length_974_cov_27.059929_g5162_i0.p1 GENE.NODE_5743_length_974_cov_27.059929_g5162_i0~~NODE_5743_length_974_cov_27.059929_g5162_i0.p1  ORF type:complete len:149 (+),score=19.62 NODE_5743_length_974_cov_27.059929_g5162_i0:414-860(+)